MSPPGWSPTEIARELAWALQSHADASRRAGRPVPHWLPALAGLCTAWATGGASAQPLEVAIRPEPRLLTLDQVAHLLGDVSTSTVRRVIREGQLPVVHVTPQTPRVRREEIDAYLDALANPERCATAVSDVQRRSISHDDTQDGHRRSHGPNEDRPHAA